MGKEGGCRGPTIAVAFQGSATGQPVRLLGLLYLMSCEASVCFPTACPEPSGIPGQLGFAGVTAGGGAEAAGSQRPVPPAPPAPPADTRCELSTELLLHLLFLMFFKRIIILLKDRTSKNAHRTQPSHTEHGPVGSVPPGGTQRRKAFSLQLLVGKLPAPHPCVCRRPWAPSVWAKRSSPSAGTVGTGRCPRRVGRLSANQDSSRRQHLKTGRTVLPVNGASTAWLWLSL